MLHITDVDWISLSPYERRCHMKENKYFTCHEPGCQPWKHSRNPWKKEKPKGSSQSNLPLVTTMAPREIIILAELYKTKNGKIFET